MKQARNLIEQIARTWIGTPYQINQRCLGVGVDCAQLPIAVYHEAGLIKEINPIYAQDWHLHTNDELYIKYVLDCGASEILPEQAQIGDLGIWQWGRAFSHGAIMVSDNCVIHSYVDIGVCEDRLDTHEELKRRPVRWFTFWP